LNRTPPDKKRNKDRSRERIDPAGASVMAVGLAAVEQPERER
jgi:phage terminase large subunit-like protein